MSIIARAGEPIRHIHERIISMRSIIVWSRGSLTDLKRGSDPGLEKEVKQSLSPKVGASCLS